MNRQNVDDERQSVESALLEACSRIGHGGVKTVDLGELFPADFPMGSWTPRAEVEFELLGPSDPTTKVAS